MGTATTSHVTSIRLAPDEHAALKRIAAADRRSLSNELRHLIAARAAELDAEERAVA
jgi:predicted transcriptional regulator